MLTALAPSIAAFSAAPENSGVRRAMIFTSTLSAFRTCIVLNACVQNFLLSSNKPYSTTFTIKLQNADKNRHNSKRIIGVMLALHQYSESTSHMPQKILKPSKPRYKIKYILPEEKKNTFVM
jgi:hypothetical protein